MQLLSKLPVLLLAAVPGVRSTGRAGSPVERVVKLLEGLKERITKDGEKEQAVYDKYACWCEKTTARKAQAIEDAKNDLRSLGQEILTQRGTIASKSAEIEQTTKDIKENEVAQQKATAIRQKENKAYMEESSELQQAISALEAAIIVLRGATGGGDTALLQKRFMASERGLAAAGRAVVAVATVQDAISGVPARSLAKLEKPGAASSVKRLALLRSYAEELAKSGSHGKYTPQSATIVGILDEMYSTFSTDLETMVSEEADKNRGFEDLMATKQEELLELQDTLKKAEEAKAAAEVALAEATQSYDDTEKQLEADVEFFDATVPACTAKSDEWKERKTLRTEELEGISKALEVLTSDEAREVFGKSFNEGKTSATAPEFLQVSAVPAKAASSKAYAALKAVATKSHSLRLARVAAAVKVAKAGHFDKVISAIDKIVEDLKAEQKSDTEKRDECQEQYTEIKSTMDDLDWKIEKNEAAIDKLDALIKKLEDDKAQTAKDITQIKKDIVDMKKTRKDENEAFKQAKKDDEDAIKLIQEAKDYVASYYEKNGIKMGPVSGGEGVGLVQQGPEFEKSEDTAPEADFSDKGHRKGESKGVVAILAHLIEELEGEIKMAQKDEEEAQLAFEDQLKKAEKLQEDLEEKEVNLGKAITDRKADKTDEEKDKTANEKDLQSEKDYKKEIKPDCDFAIDKYEERMEKRTAELDGLRQAKEFLAGYQPPSAELLQAESAEVDLDSGAAALLGLAPPSRRSMMAALIAHPAA